MFTRKTIPFIVGSILLVAVAFLFLTHELNWTYVSDLYKDEPAIVVVPEEEPWQTVKLEVAVSLDEQQYEELVSLSEAIAEQYPQLDVHITNYYEQHSSYSEWETLARLGKLGDIQLVPNEWVVPLAIQGIYQPVDRVMNNEVLSDQLPGIVDALKWNGYMWAVPYESNPYLLFVHRQAAEQIKQLEISQGNNEKEDKTREDRVSQGDMEADAVDQENTESSEDVANQEKTGKSEGTANEESTGESDESKTQEEAESPFVFTNWGFQEWQELYEQMPDFTGPMLNVDPDQLTSLFTWLSLWQHTEDNRMSLTELSDPQLEMLHYLSEHPQLIQLSLTVDNDDFSGQAPMLYATTAKKYYDQHELIAEHYELNLLTAPLPWMNGKSFMLSAGTFGNQKNEAAMQWLEMINRGQPQGSIIHRKMYAQLSSDYVQAALGKQFQQKLSSRQLFVMTSKWASNYEQLQQRWLDASTLEDKLAIFTEAK